MGKLTKPDPSTNPEIPASPATFVKEADNIIPFPSAIQSGVSSQALEVIYSEWIGLRPYKIQDAPEPIKQAWKKEIENIIIYLQQKNPRDLEVLGTRRNEFWGDRYMDPYAIYDILEAPDFDHEQMILLAIALFLFQQKAKYKFLRGHFKAVCGGKYNLENFIGHDKDANCVDIACLTRELARLYSIDGDILEGACDHRYFLTDSGRVIDIMGGWKKGGVFSTEAEYLLYYLQSEDS